jgi:transposase
MTDDITVAKLRLADLEKSERQKAESQANVTRGKLTFGEAATTYIQRITGVGTITALRVLAELSKLSTLNRRQAAALAGLAPHPRESGQWHGRRGDKEIYDF